MGWRVHPACILLAGDVLRTSLPLARLRTRPTGKPGGRAPGSSPSEPVRQVEHDAPSRAPALRPFGPLRARSARVLAAFGDRFDQSLAALLIAARLARDPAAFPVALHGGNHSAYPVTPALPRRLHLPYGTVLSLLSLEGNAVVSVGGVRYALDHALLPFGTGLGVSNVATEDIVEVTCFEGSVALIVEHSETRA